jgi:hypothetical protein
MVGLIQLNWIKINNMALLIERKLRVNIILAIYYVMLIFQYNISILLSWCYETLVGRPFDIFSPFQLAFYVLMAVFPLIFFTFCLVSKTKLLWYQRVLAIGGLIFGVIVFRLW